MKVGLLSDLHIGSPQSKWGDAATLINRIAPDLDALILMGDITEELNPYSQTLNLGKGDQLKKRIENVLDQFVDKVSEYINKIVFLRGNHDDQLLNKCSLVEPYAILRSQFGRIIVLHGHLTNLTTYGLNLGWGIQAGRALKKNVETEYNCGIKLKTTDYLIVGHCHVAYADPHNKIYSPGCWVGVYQNRNTGWYILINDEGIDSPKTMIQMRRNVPSRYHIKRCKCGFHKLTKDDLYCPVCGVELTPKCGKTNCQRPLRGEEKLICKKHNNPTLKFYE